MSRKEFIQKNGATCKNWVWSWAFINKIDKIVIFGEWDKNYEQEKDRTVLLDETRHTGNKKKDNYGYKEALGYIRLVYNENYKLFTFPMIHSNTKNDGSGHSEIKKFIPILTEKVLSYENGKWYASNVERLAEEIETNEAYYEGATKKIVINAYERNSNARMVCIEHYGATCCVCGFNFEKVYGNIGKGFIHVHHIVPIANIKKEYILDPIKDLRPICPNCHSIIHRNKKTLTIEQLKE